MKILERTGWLALAFLLLAGCQEVSVVPAGQLPDACISVRRGEEDDTVLTADILTVSTDAYAQTLRDRMGEEWDRYENTSPEGRLLSSHLWGTCTSRFYSWASAEDFVGFSVKNPLEGQDWLTLQDKFGVMGEEEKGLPVEVSYGGADRDTVDYAILRADYLAGEVRVQFSAGVYAQSPFTMTEKRNADSAAFLDDKNGVMFELVEEENYVSKTAYLVQGQVVYAVYTVGDPGQAEAVTETMDQILALF